MLVIADRISASTPASEKRPRLAWPMPVAALKLPISARSGELVSPVSAPQPARKKLNSSLPAREKKTFDGIASSLVSMPARVSMAAIACATFSSLM